MTDFKEIQQKQAKIGTQEVVTTVSNTSKLILSLIILYCSFAVGLRASFLGAPLLEFAEHFDTDVNTISKVFPFMTAASLTGVTFWGMAYNYVNRQLCCVFLLSCAGITTAVLPFKPSISYFFWNSALIGFVVGRYATAQVVWIIEMWGNSAPPYVQAQHFAFALGTLVSPLLIKPFLASYNNNNNMSPDVNSKLDGSGGYLSNSTSSNIMGNSTIIGNYTRLGQIHHPITPHNSSSNLQIPFLVGGIVYILGGILLLIMFFVKRYVKPKTNIKNDQGLEEHNVTHGINSSQQNVLSKSCQRALLICLSAIIIASYQGMEICTTQFLPTFAYFINLKLPLADGTLVLSGLAGSFTLGRGAGIFIVFKVKPELLLLCNMILIFLGNSILYLFANDYLCALWIGSIALGIGFSTAFACYYSFIGKHLIISDVVGAIMFVDGGLISSTYPIIIGKFITHHPFVLIYSNYVSILTCTVCFIVVYLVTRTKTGCEQGKGQVDLNFNVEDKCNDKGIEQSNQHF